MPPDPGGGDGRQNSFPDQRTETPAWNGESAFGGTFRTFPQILEEEKRNRNILELKITKIISQDEHGEQQRPRSLTFEELGEFLFDVLNINPEDCMAVNLNTGRYDHREVKFKPGIDTAPFLRFAPVTFKDHSITVNRQSQNITRVTFKNSL